jgi:hypothetical protein
MITDDLRTLMHADPFLPIRVVVDSERTYLVTHVDYIAVSPDRQSLVLYDENGHARFLNAQQIRVVEQVQPGSKTTR